MIHDKFISIVDTIHEDFEVIIVVAHNLWLRRNSLVNGGDFGQPNQFVQTTIDSLQEFKDAQVRLPETSGDISMGIHRWQAPPWELVKR